jgi:hypothetical protein
MNRRRELHTCVTKSYGMKLKVLWMCVAESGGMFLTEVQEKYTGQSCKRRKENRYVFGSMRNMLEGFRKRVTESGNVFDTSSSRSIQDSRVQSEKRIACMCYQVIIFSL